MSQFKELDDYIDFLRSRGRKETTLFGYATNLNMILRTLKKGGRHWKVREIDEDDIQWLNMNLTDRTESVRKYYIRLLSNMILYYTGVDVGKRAALLFNDDIGCRHVHYITKEQFQTLYARADETDRLILVLGTFMGLRRAEMANIRMTDIKGDKILIRGKGHGPDGKLVEMKMPERVRAEIDAYLEFKHNCKFGCEDVNLIEGYKHGAP